MQNGQIRDAQITASSENDENHAAVQGRLNFKAGRGKTGAWSAYGNLVNQWLQVDLGRYSIVTGIATQGRNAYPQWVTLYELQCSEDDPWLSASCVKSDQPQVQLVINVIVLS